jgi:hypothetical protein
VVRGRDHGNLPSQAVTDEVKQGDEWTPYVIARTYNIDETRDCLPSERKMATER